MLKFNFLYLYFFKKVYSFLKLTCKNVLMALYSHYKSGTHTNIHNTCTCTHTTNLALTSFNLTLLHTDHTKDLVQQRPMPNTP